MFPRLAAAGLAPQQELARLESPKRDEEKLMIEVTPPALDLLRGMQHPEGTVLRLDPVADGKLGFAAGDARPDDQVVEESGEEVLHIAGQLSQAYDGCTIERVDTPEGPRLSMTRPDPNTE